jgi:hypothetical protein
MPTEQLEARVTLIHKKGKTDQYENYRPISLLNTLYQIFAALIQKRLAKGTDKLQTQYGFRKDRSTSKLAMLTLSWDLLESLART